MITNLKITGLVTGALLLALTAVWLHLAPKIEAARSGLDRIGLTILVDWAGKQ